MEKTVVILRSGEPRGPEAYEYRSRLSATSQFSVRASATLPTAGKWASFPGRRSRHLRRRACIDLRLADDGSSRFPIASKPSSGRPEGSITVTLMRLVIGCCSVAHVWSLLFHRLYRQSCLFGGGGVVLPSACRHPRQQNGDVRSPIEVSQTAPLQQPGFFPGQHTGNCIRNPGG